MPEKYWIKVDPKKCELVGPYECPTCQGHIMLDATFIDQVTALVNCPYCCDSIEFNTDCKF